MIRILTALTLGVALALPAQADRGHGDRFDARLEGFNAAGVPIPTSAHGRARVEVIDAGTALRFRVMVHGIDNLLMAHIHIAPEPVELTGPAGPVAYWFVGGPPPGDTLTETVNGRLAEGYVITDGDVVDWAPMDENQMDSGTVAGLIRAISEGRASVVVHTDDLDPDTPTGMQGDSRAGELRGTLE